jgi:hypothetical protein
MESDGPPLAAIPSRTCWYVYLLPSGLRTVSNRNWSFVAMTPGSSGICSSALACCFVSALLAGGMIPIGNTTRRGELAERGKTTLICAVIGSVIVAIACSLITSSYGLGS